MTFEKNEGIEYDDVKRNEFIAYAHNCDRGSNGSVPLSLLGEDIMQRYDLDSIEYYNTMFKSYPDVVNVKGLQKMLNIGERRAYELLKSGEIPFIKFNRGYRIPKVAVIAYLYKKMKG